MPQEWKHWQGQKINNRFVLGQYLGGSNDSAVFVTTLDSAGQKAAIKIIALPEDKADSTLSRWNSIKTLSHPHLIQLYEAGRDSLGEKKLLYVVMEYAEENLSTILPSRALTPEEAREMLDPALDALAYIHAQGLVHGHIKPSNIMATGETLRLSCDGIAPPGQQPHVKDSPYAPPEAASAGLSNAGDVWSLGVTLVEVLTQRVPASRNIRDILPTLPAPFRSIAEKSLQSDPRQRYSIEDIRRELRPSTAGANVHQINNRQINDRPIGQRPAVESPARRSFFAPVAIVVLLAILLAAALIFSHRSSHSESSQPTTQARAPVAAPAETNAVPAGVAESATAGSNSPAKVIHRVSPDVSSNALRTVHGTVKVRVRLHVDAAGNVEEARVESRGPSRYFSSKALEAAKQWKFEPPVKDGKNLPSEWNLEFLFTDRSSTVHEKQVRP